MKRDLFNLTGGEEFLNLSILLVMKVGSHRLRSFIIFFFFPLFIHSFQSPLFVLFFYYCN